MADTISELRRILRAAAPSRGGWTLSAGGTGRATSPPRVRTGHGYRIVPVNPRYTEVLGETCYPSLEAWFRFRSTWSTCSTKPDDVPPIARAAVAIGAKCLWQQLGVKNLGPMPSRAQPASIR